MVGEKIENIKWKGADLIIGEYLGYTVFDALASILRMSKKAYQEHGLESEIKVNFFDLDNWYIEYHQLADAYVLSDPDNVNHNIIGFKIRFISVSGDVCNVIFIPLREKDEGYAPIYFKTPHRLFLREGGVDIRYI